MARRSKRLTDLYVQGTEVVLKDGSVIWLQIPNPFERDESTHDGQVARSRLVMALKQHGSDELAKVQAALLLDGRERAVDRLIDAKVSALYVKAVEGIENDPEWQERLEIRKRTDELLARPTEDPERQLLTALDREYIDAVNAAVNAEVDFLRERYMAAEEEELEAEYVDLYLERRGGDVALAEMQLTELWYAVRVCDATEAEGQWVHSTCDHSQRMFEDKAEVRSAPEDLTDLLSERLAELQMTVRDARFSARQGSSSGSSPLPSEAAESTPSIPTETPVGAPGS